MPLLPTDGPFPNLGLTWFADFDPTVTPGIAAPIGQFLIRTDNSSLYYKSGDPQLAAEGFKRAWALDPNRYEIHNGLGLALTDLGQYEAASEILQKGCVLQPESAELSASLGYLFEAKGDLAAAVEAYRRAITLGPKLVGAHRELGLVLFGLG